MAVHTFIHISSTLWHWPVPPATTEETLMTQPFWTAVTYTYAYAMEKVRAKANCTTCIRLSTNTVAGNRLLVSICIASHKIYLSIALSVLQQLEGIHKTQPTLQQISAMVARSNRRNFPEHSYWEWPLSPGFQCMFNISPVKHMISMRT